MKNQKIKFEQGLTIQELKERNNLSLKVINEECADNTLKMPLIQNNLVA